MPRFCPECGDKLDSDTLNCPKDGTRTYSIVESGDLIGRQIDGRFTIHETLGKGGMGTVYRARQHSLDRDVAIKLLCHDQLSDEQSVRRFFRESRATSRLVNPHTVTVLDFGQDPSDGTFYIVMELLKGCPLTTRMGPGNGPMEPERAAGLMSQVLESLEEAHDAGVLHRDLKPDNIYLLDVPSDFVKVLDFGIAKLFKTETEPITDEGLAYGTPQYMSPEQAFGKVLDVRSDLYSVGLILFELLSGRLPFSGETSLEMIVHRIQQPAPSLREINPDLRIPKHLEELVSRLLGTDPKGRPGNARETRLLLTGAEAKTAPIGAPPIVGADEAPPSGPDTVREMSKNAVALTRILLAAKERARESQSFYTESLKKCTSEPARRVFAEFTEDYETYIESLTDAGSSLDSGDNDWSLLLRPRTENQTMAVRFEKLDEVQVNAIRQDPVFLRTLDAGLALERKSVDEWEQKLATVGPTQGRELVKVLLVVGRGRVAILAEIKLHVVGLIRKAGSGSFYSKLAGLLPIKRVRKDDVLFRQGEPGDTMVIVVSGRFRLEMDDSRGNRSIVGELGAGDVVGEMTCIDPAARSATVTALCDSEVYTLDRGTLSALRVSRPEIYVAVNRGVIAQITGRVRETVAQIEKLFRELLLTPLAMPGSVGVKGGKQQTMRRLDDGQPSDTGSLRLPLVAELAEISDHRRYPAGAVLCQEGEPGRSCFVVLKGHLQINKLVDGEELELGQLTKGSIAGQFVLADGGPHSASIRAGSDVEVLELDRLTFDRLVEEHVPLALQFQEQIAVSGIRQLRLADRWMTMLLSRKTEARTTTDRQKTRQGRPPAGSAAVSQMQPIPKSVPRPEDDRDASKKMKTYMQTALQEWGMSMDELDEIHVSTPDGQISQAEIKARLDR